MITRSKQYDVFVPSTCAYITYSRYVLLACDTPTPETNCISVCVCVCGGGVPSIFLLPNIIECLTARYDGATTHVKKVHSKWNQPHFIRSALQMEPTLAKRDAQRARTGMKASSRRATFQLLTKDMTIPPKKVAIHWMKRESFSPMPS